MIYGWETFNPALEYSSISRSRFMIVRSNPPANTDLDHADQAWFDSDAGTNDAAIQDVDAEAAKHGLVRTREYWLQTFRMPDGKIVRRGFCYRPDPGGSGLADRLASRRGTATQGATSAQMVREIREQE